mmetsp:Transcript_31960/g.42186  ORF Transcript_31960/g.42186 Transcript_31960/m.42186 type:complete len:157 (-) Transcript_31960:252-722(-)
MNLDFLQKLDNICPPHFSPYGCLLALIMITYGVHFFRAGLIIIKKRGFNLAEPRKNAPQGVIKGYIGGVIDRLRAAHENCFENLILTSAAILSAVQANVSTELISSLGTLIVLTRIFFCILYGLISNQGLAVLRSAVFVLGLAAIVRLFTLAIANS